MLDLDSIAIDPDKAEKGVWAEYLGAEFLLVRRGPEYNARLSDLVRESRLEIDKPGKEGTQALVRCYQRAFCDTLLKGWKGIKRGGKELKFSPDTAMEVLSDVKFRELLNFLETFSLQHHHYRAEADAKVAKSVKPTAAS